MARKAKNPPIEVKEKEVEASEESEEILFGEEDLENSGLRELVDKGKDQGFLTYEDINSMLPEDISDPDQVEETIQMLMDIGIEVLESTSTASDDSSESAPETIADTRTTLTTVESEVGRTTDPVRLYMREMGTVDLLTRETVSAASAAGCRTSSRLSSSVVVWVFKVWILRSGCLFL